MNQALAEFNETLGLFAGTILPYAGNAASLPTGWVVCGQDGTPDLGGHFLLGTNDLANVGVFVGSDEHDHSINFQSTEQSSGRFASTTEGADNHTGRNWQHQHRVVGSTAPTAHIPPAVQVLFLCKPVVE